MVIKSIQALLQPKSVAVVGASPRPGALGQRVVEHLHQAGFNGPVLPVHPRHATVQRIACHRAVEQLPFTPDLAVVCAPAAQAAAYLDQLGERGVRAGIVMAQDPDGDAPDTPFKQALHQAAGRHGMRWLGPGSAGVQWPRAGLNASAMGAMPPEGRIALVAQSAALAASVLEVAARQGIGFSSVATLGDGSDLDVPDLLDQFAADGRTQAVMVALSRIRDGSRFMVSARALARLKPVVVLWAGSTDAAPTVDGAPVVDHRLVCEAAFHRAGLLRVDGMGQWFDALEMLATGRRRVGERLAVISNGPGPGALAQAALAGRHPLADFTDACRTELAPHLPKGAAPANPLDLGVDAQAARYEAVLNALIRQDAADAFLVVVNPCGPQAQQAIATVIAKAASSSGRTVMSCWPGGAPQTVHSTLAAAEVSVFELPELAAQSYLHLLRFRRDQEALKQIPDPCSFRSASLGHALALSDEAETPQYLRAYGTLSAAIMAEQPVIEGEAASAVLAAVGLQCTAAGPLLPLRFTVADDLVFGRALSVSVGRRDWVLLPALNTALVRETAQAVAEELARVVQGGAAAPGPEAITQAVLQVADLVVGFPEIVALEIPAFSWQGARLQPTGARVWPKAHLAGQRHLAIPPYPREAEEKITLRDGRVALLRPLRPSEDIELLADLVAHVSADDRFLRFSKVVQGVPPELLAKMARVDYDREMGFVALVEGEQGQPVLLGVVDAFVMPDHSEAEFSILLRSDLKRAGLGAALMRKIMAYCERRGIQTLVGLVLKQNHGMRGLATHLGFVTEVDPDDDMVTVRLALQPRQPA
jgi:acetyl-CoA synthetase (ADP-forming)/acetyltransferase